MAVKRRVSFVSQQRVDVPDLRSLESATANDFDDLIKSFVTGTNQGYILRGFEISMSGAIGGAASGLQLLVDPGAVFHIASSQAGSMYLVPPGTSSQQLNSATNTIVDGSFSPSAINYIGLEYERYVDDTTTSQIYLWDPTTNSETTKTAPRAQILRYRIKISTSIPASNILPIAAVSTDAGNNVTSITDARFMLMSLGRGGFSPNPSFVYPWTAQAEGQTANPPTSNSNSINPFHGGDKMLGTLKDWMDAMMSEIQGIKGTPYWFSLSSSGSLETLREDLGNTIITGRGHISHSKITPGLINWDNDINVRVVGSRLAYTLLANPASTDVTLTDDQVAYVTLVRGMSVVPNLIFTNGSPVVSSVGLISWTSPLVPGDWIKLSSSTDSGYYKILTVDSLTQVTLTENYGGASTGAPGTKAKYAFGSYQTSPTPSTNRHIYVSLRKDVPSGQNVFWLLVRSDNAGTIARVYIRFLGSELQQGEDREISDDIPLQMLQYMGSAIESSSKPLYAVAYNPAAVPQIVQILSANAAAISSGQYFIINSSGNARIYYAWFKKDGVGSDPTPPNTTIGIEVDITTGMTDVQVAAATTSALNSTVARDFTAFQLAVPNANTIRVTNNSAGVCASPANYNVPAPFAIIITQTGVGVGNTSMQDGDNLTLAIKEVDIAIANIFAALNSPSYDEPISIVSSAANPPTSLLGPVTAGTQIVLPNNSRLGNVAQFYTAGKGVMVVNLNGQVLRLGSDWNEVGVSGASSNKITLNSNLVVGDSLVLRISAGGGSGGGGGTQGPPGPPGAPGATGANAVGGPVGIATKTSNYTVQLSDNVILADATAGTLTLTLPTSASATGRVFYFKKIDATVNAMVIQGNGAELIDGLNTKTSVVRNESFMLICNGTAYYIF